MSYTILLTREAEEQFREADEWWQANRGASPDLLVDEFEQACRLLREVPNLGARFARSTVPGVRRILLPRSAYWVYYIPDEIHLLVHVLAVWSTRRGSDPELGS